MTETQTHPGTHTALATAEEIALDWATSPRWHGIARTYSAEDVVRLRGTVHEEHTLARRGADDIPLEDILALDAQRPRTLQEVESIRAERNALSKEVGEMARLVKTADSKEAQRAEHRRSDLVARSSSLGDKLETLEGQLRDLDGRLRHLLLLVLNLPAESAVNICTDRIRTDLSCYVHFYGRIDSNHIIIPRNIKGMIRIVSRMGFEHRIIIGKIIEFLRTQ